MHAKRAKQKPVEPSKASATDFAFSLFRWSVFFPAFEIQNAARETVLRIEGPLFNCNAVCTDVDFDVRMTFCYVYYYCSYCGLQLSDP